MRQLILLTAAALCLLILAAPALAEQPPRNCPDEHRECYADYGKGAYLGKVACPTCWKWKDFACEFCWGNKEAVSRCESAHPACKGTCWSCDGGRDGCCLDKDGHEHGDCANLSRRKPQS